MEVPISVGEPGMEMQAAGDEPQVPSTHQHCTGVVIAQAEPNLSLHKVGTTSCNAQKHSPQWRSPWGQSL